MKTNRIKGIEKKSLQYLLDSIDDQIFLSEKWKREFGQKDSLVVNPFISKEIFDSLYKIKPTLESKNICIIASQDYYYKGLDLLIDSFKIVKKKYPESNLYVIGKIEIPEEYQNVNGVHLLGRVDKIEDVFEKCSLYVHPARGENFGVAIIEAMCAGLPIIVSKETGSAELLEKKWRCNLNPKEISNKIIKFFELNKRDKEKNSKENKIKSKKYQEKIKIKEFEEKIKKVIEC
jgi:glycosyltransferase involved in cell wall biosynthesis